MTAASLALPTTSQSQPDYKLDIAPYTLELSAKHSIKTIAYNQQVPGPLLRMQEGKPVTIQVTNRTANEEIVHWHGLYLPPNIDGAMEEGTPMLPPIKSVPTDPNQPSSATYTFTPAPAGCRWYHTHTFAGGDLKKGQYTGQHGFLLIEPERNPARYDQEIFLALHDWDGQMLNAGDGSMNPAYQFSSINGKLLGAAEPIRVKPGQRVLMHLLNASASDPHWIALAGHKFQVIALDGNPLPTPQTVPMLRLAPAERVSALVQMNNPGTWILGEVRKHVQAAGMGIVVEYANSTSAPKWQQPNDLIWNYHQFAAADPAPPSTDTPIEIPLTFESRFAGHGAPDHWRINGKSWPLVDSTLLRNGQRYRLRFINKSTDDHPVHLHRHSFELKALPNQPNLSGIHKDVILVDAKTEVSVEFTANHPGPTLFHCHQQNHMDEGFMMLFQYA